MAISQNTEEMVLTWGRLSAHGPGLAAALRSELILLVLSTGTI